MKAMEWKLEPGDWTTEELALAEKFEKEKYSGDEWNMKR